MTTTIESNRKIYQQLTHRQISFMSELFRHLLAKKQEDVYILLDHDVEADYLSLIDEEQENFPKVENSRVCSVFDMFQESIIGQGVFGQGLSLTLENFCNAFITFDSGTEDAINYTLLEYIDSLYVNRAYYNSYGNKVWRRNDDIEWKNILNIGKEILNMIFKEWKESELSRCTIVFLEEIGKLKKSDKKKADDMVADYKAQEKK
jgi:hypothetical protein